MKPLSAKPAIRFFLALFLSAASAAVVIGALPLHGEEQLYDRVIRLHVIAASDTAEDQALKLRVRDAVLSYLAEYAPDCASVDDAEEAYKALLPELDAVAEETVRHAGYAYSCQVSLTREAYPIRSYDSGTGTVTLPAGTYRSLRVRIGEAAGQNWWCVLFPPLCLSLAAEYEVTAAPTAAQICDDTGEQLLAAGFTPYEVSLISGGQEPKTVLKFRIVEFFRSLLNKN